MPLRGTTAREDLSMLTMIRHHVGTVAAMLLATIVTAGSPARAETALVVMVFQGVQNLPLYAARAKGMFAKRDLRVDLKIAPNSDEVRSGLAAGRHQIVHSAIDNSLAMVDAGADAAIVMGGDSGFNSLIVQPGIRSFDELRGKIVAVDAVNTAFAFLLYEMLKRNGLMPGDYTPKPVGASFRRVEALIQDKSLAASVLNPPFSMRATEAGLQNWGSAVAAVGGSYQATGAYVLRSWAQANAGTLARYIQGYVEGLRWSLDPANREEAIRLLVDGLKLTPAVAAQCYDIMADPAGGLAKDAALDVEGLQTVLRLRRAYGGGTASAPDKYLDLSYYRSALAGM
jgi:ABC-type nitrate/sulfonate/bicarbonate transport system substrate-binding protein